MPREDYFDLYFAGSRSTRTDEIFKELELPRLFSQLNDRSAINKYVKEGYKGKLFIDSGAHSVHTKGRTVDVDEYIEYINSIDDHVHVFVQVDKIPGVYLQPKTKEDWEQAPIQTWENFLYMYERVKSPEKMMAVHHMGENLSHLEKMLNWVDDKGRKMERLCLSPRGDVSVKSKVEYIDDCYKIIEKSNNPDIQVHALGMTSFKVLPKSRLNSADSTTWLINGVLGRILTPRGIIAISEANLKNKDHINNQGPEAIKWVSDYLSQWGITIQECMEDYDKRLEVNIRYLNDYLINFKREPGSSVKRNKRRLF